MLFQNAVMGKVPPMGGAAEAGIILHSIFEDVQKGELAPSSFDMKQRFEIEVEDWNMKLRDKDDIEFEHSIVTDVLLENGRNAIDNWLNEVYNNLLDADRFEVEKNIVFDIGEESLIGCTLDRITWEGDEIHIHDWKTGKPLSGQNLITNLQPGVYIYAVFQEYGVFPESFTLHYLGEPYKAKTYIHQGDGIYIIKTPRKTYTLDVYETIEECRRIIKHINNGEFPANGKKWFCDKMCWYRKSGDCEEVSA